MENELRMKKLRNISWIVVFCLFLSAAFLLNTDSLVKALYKQKFEFSSWQKTANVVETKLKESVEGRQQLIDVYGVSLMAFQRNLVGNFEFVKDENGIMRRFEKAPNTTHFFRSINNLNAQLEEKGIPLVYVLMPDNTEGCSLAKEFHFVSGQDEEFLENLNATGADVFNVGTLCESDPACPKAADFYLSTDSHPTTYAEFYTAKKVVDYLSEEYKIQFHQVDTVFDLMQYDITSYDFIGAFSRSTGHYFTGINQFENYLPKFDSNFTVFDENLNAVITGDFASALMHGHHEKENLTMYNYWIRNYGYYPKPYYEYQNNQNPDGPNLLILADSNFMRAETFLASVCGNTTIVDMRFADGVEYVEQALNMREYDAVLMCGTSQKFLSTAFSVETTLPDVPTKPAQDPGYNIGNHGLAIRGANNRNIEIDLSQPMVNIEGWAADFINEKPLQELYIQIGDIVQKCHYGLADSSVSKHFENENLLKTGFTVSVPTAYFQNQNIKRMKFILVGDGFQYEPAVVKVSYQTK